MPIVLRKPLVTTTAAVFAAVLVVLAFVNRSSTPTPNPVGASPRVDVAPAGASTQARIDGLEALIKDGGANPQTYAALGGEMLQRLRETGDPTLYPRAEMAFTEALKRDPSNLDAKVGIGTLALARHDFSGALRYGRAARQTDPGSFAPFAVLVDAEIELGRYGVAERTLQQMVDFKPTLSSYARVSYFRELHGDLEGAVAAMRLAAATAPGPGENSSYIQTLLGNLEFERGRLDAAEASYRGALAAFPGYPRATAGLAGVDAARRHFEPAIEVLRGVVERLPLPEFVIGLGETQQAAGKTMAAQASYALVGVEAKLLRANGVNTDVDLALFEANHGSAAKGVVLGRRAWDEAPSVRSADAYAWALSRGGRDAAALRFSAEAMKLGSRDPSFLYHAGMIAKRAGRDESARRYLSQLVVQSPRFNPLYGPRAQRALEGLG
jgi:tetratricopeptide (TPR) repeat protein